MICIRKTWGRWGWGNSGWNCK